MLRKEGGVREAAFYDEARKSLNLYQGILELMPGFGEVNVPDGVIMMENMLQGMGSACLLDIKMGKLLHDDHASAEKLYKMMWKIPGTTTESHAFRLTAIKCVDKHGKVFEIDRKTCPKVPEIAKCLELPYDNPDRKKELEDVVLATALRRFVDPSGEGGKECVAIAKSFLNATEKVFAWFKINDKYVFRGNSLFYVHDTSAPDRAASAKMRMIDFAHVMEMKPQQKAKGDIEYMEGLENLITIWKKVLDMLEAEK